MKKLFSLLTLALLTLSVGAANTYVKVTSADQLVAGKKYIIVNEDAVTVMGAVGTYGAAIVSEKTINDGILDIEDRAHGPLPSTRPLTLPTLAPRTP